jgi:hypothetical protein
MKQKLKLYKHFISSIAFLIFLFLAIGSVDDDSSSSKSKDPNAWKEGNDKIMAYIMMQDFVKRRLKSPRTAKFAGASEKMSHTTYLGNQKYKIHSYVDAQNTFGALIRTQFIGEIEQVSEKEWQLISLKLLE